MTRLQHATVGMATVTVVYVLQQLVVLVGLLHALPAPVDSGIRLLGVGAWAVLLGTWASRVSDRAAQAQPMDAKVYDLGQRIAQKINR